MATATWGGEAHWSAKADAWDGYTDDATVDREGDVPFRTVSVVCGNALTLGANAQAHPDTQTLKAHVTPGRQGSGPMHRDFLQRTELFAFAPTPVAYLQRTSLFETSMDRRGPNASDARVESCSHDMDDDHAMLSWIQGDLTRAEQVVDVGTRTQTLVVPILAGAEFDIGF